MAKSPSLSTTLKPFRPALKLIPAKWRGVVSVLLVVAVAGWVWYSAQPPAQTTQPPVDGQVLKVVDGDTLDVQVNGQSQRIRLIGVDTPEVVDPRKPVQCFGQQASNRTHQLADNQIVTLQSDPTQDDSDKYGRLLRYVFLSDGQMLNQLLIAQGYAHEYTYQVPYQYQAEFKQAQKDAEQKQLGLWSPDTCKGKTK